MLKHWILEHDMLVQADCNRLAFKRGTCAACEDQEIACRLTRIAVAAEERFGALSSDSASLACVQGCMAVAILLHPGLLERPAKVLVTYCACDLLYPLAKAFAWQSRRHRTPHQHFA